MEAPAGSDEVEQDLFVSPEQFDGQLADLAKRGFRSIRLDQYLHAPERSILITFDDAYTHVAEKATPLLMKYGFSAVMFTPAAHLGGRNTWDAGTHPNLAALKITSVAEIRAMAAGPWEIASHGFRHVDLRKVPPELRRKDLALARESLSDVAGRPVMAIAYPYGYSDAGVRQDAMSAGYRMAFSASSGPSHDPFELPRHQVRGTDDLRMFRLKTSPWFDRLYRVQRLTPDWVKGTARALVGAR